MTGMNKKFKLRSESIIFILVLVGILVLVNLLSVRFFSRLDLTRDGVFTLSKASISMAKDLDDKLVVKAYFTKNLPGRFASLERHVKDMLDEYKQHSRGQMIVEFIDPDEDEEGDEEETAKNLGIKKMPNPDIEKDQTTIKEGYRGIAFSFGSRTEVIRAVDSPVGLEYQITTVLKKLLGYKSTMGFVIGHGEPLIEPPSESDRPLLPDEKLSRGAYKNLRRNFDLYNYNEVDLKGGTVDIPQDTDALLVVGPTGKYDDKELYKIDQFLLNGGAVAMFISGTNVAIRPSEIPMLPSTFETSRNEAGLVDFLKHHGVEFGTELVFDKQSTNYISKCPPMPLPLPRPYPAWPIITAFDEDHPVAFRLGSLTLPYATPVRISKTVENDPSMKAAELAFSSGNSWAVEGEDAIIEPCGSFESTDLQSGIPVVVALTGDFTSFFDGKDLPVEQKDDKEEGDRDFIAKSVKPGRLIVIGSAALPMDESLMYLARIDRRQAHNNLTFIQNVLDWLTSEDDLIAVRMKNVNDPPLEKGSEGAKTTAKWVNIIGVPFVFILFGVVRWRIRAFRKSRRASAGADEKKGRKAQ
jgi:ABC-2 type transport system permease protein